MMSHTTPRSLTMVVASLLLGAGLAGCVTQDASASTGELYVKDALTDEAAEVHVTFTRAEVLPAQSQAWEAVYEGERTIDLLNLTSSEAKEQLSDFEIEPGEYSRMRLAVSNVTVVHHNGSESSAVVYGNTVTIAKNLTFEAGQPLQILVDVDLEKGVDLNRSEFVPVVGDVQTSAEDADQDGQPDFVDTDDDDDGVEDAEDDDRNGDGQPDLPAQSQAMNKQGLHGLCTAWEASEDGRQHADNGTDNRSDNSTDANATANETADEPHAFDWLRKQADQSGQSVEAYCEEQTRPGAPDSLSEVLPEDLPEKAQQAVQDRHLGPPEDAGADQREDRGNQSDRDQQARDGNRSGQDGNASQPDDNRTGGNQTDGNRTDGSGDGGQQGQNRTGSDGNETKGDGGR